MTPSVETAAPRTIVLDDANIEAQQTPPGRPHLTATVAGRLPSSADRSPERDEVALRAGAGPVCATTNQMVARARTVLTRVRGQQGAVALNATSRAVVDKLPVHEREARVSSGSRSS
jgi:hypothetical protein